MMFQDKLRTLRRQHMLSQRELGQALGVSASTIGMYEQGRRQPDHRMLMKICSYFHVSADLLLGDGNELEESGDIMVEIEELGRKLMSSEALMFEGAPVTSADIRKLIDAMQLSARIVLGSSKHHQGG